MYQILHSSETTTRSVADLVLPHSLEMVMKTWTGGSRRLTRLDPSPIDENYFDYMCFMMFLSSVILCSSLILHPVFLPFSLVHCSSLLYTLCTASIRTHRWFSFVSIATQCLKSLTNPPSTPQHPMNWSQSLVSLQMQM